MSRNVGNELGTAWHRRQEFSDYLLSRDSQEISRFQCIQKFQLNFCVLFRLFLCYFLFLRNKEVRQIYKLEKCEAEIILGLL